MSQSAGQDGHECANPLFLKWVGEWYDEACARNTRTQHVLKKAYTSLQRYPLRMEDPREALQLQGIGQVIVERLAKRLAAWRQENGIPDLPQQAQTAGGGESTQASQSARSQRQTAPRIYVPRYRSGAFALLLGLYKTFCLYGPDYYIPKSQLIPLSEQYTDTPFHVGGTTSGSTGRGRGSGGSGASYGQHTAWSGIKTLESKSLVERQGGVKFCITEEGLEIVQKVVQVLRTRNELPADDGKVFADFESQHPRRLASEPVDRSEADDLGICPPGYSSPILSSSPEQSADCLPPLPRTAVAGLPSSGQQTLRATSGNGSSNISARAHSSSSYMLPPAASEVAVAAAGNVTAISRNRSAGSSRPLPPTSTFSRQSSSAAAADIELSDLIRYPKGEYDIILIVDNREVHSSADRSLIAKELEEQVVRIEIRPLTVGDFLWIARAKPTSHLRHLPDIVLDYVVERKRMDDLCASIRDGRYKEQHSRIHSTGFTNVLYVVEGENPDAVSRLGEGAVNSALSRVQVHHGFHLKRPPTFEATLKLLRQTTRCLQNTLRDVYAIPDQYIGQKEFAKLKQSIRARFPHISLALSFDAYNVVSNKSGTLSVGEIYLRMLMTVRGVSASKALTIGRNYSTPCQLTEALDCAPSGSKLVEELVIDESRRKIGPALGKRITQFWTADSFAPTTTT
ncbi:Crossover junction endonuclease mus81 [Coemansia sp. BCRC 34301]|nr:Crossover junction endonuclease mus81 [Coemansia sp. BCRC 34301]